MKWNPPPDVHTLGELKKSGYTSRSIKAEIRSNLIACIKNNQPIFKGVLGYEDTVLPELQVALLAKHNILLLGLRGQAKTRIARQITDLLDEWVPVLTDSEINEDPFQPILSHTKQKIEVTGDATPIRWMHQSERYTEKLATPDVSVADLIGDLDPIKAATQKLAYSDERAIHFGLVPHSHRGVFVINELPDLQARIQVALFNILQEKDIQIRGFKVRLPLDILFVFTANPEDYTNRGSIITPLKDRIESQILTHYPKTLEISAQITEQEAEIAPEQKNIRIPQLIKDLIEQIAFVARDSEFVDQKSGVSARLTISAFENMLAAAERRMLLCNEKQTVVRVSDLYSVIPAITGKIELVYEGEQEGPYKVAVSLLSLAIRKQFTQYFPDPEKSKKNKQQPNRYQPILDWFAGGKKLDLLHQIPTSEYKSKLNGVKGLRELVDSSLSDLSEDETYLFMEFALHGMADYSLLGKSKLERGVIFKDMLGNLLNFGAN